MHYIMCAQEQHLSTHPSGRVNAGGPVDVTSFLLPSMTNSSETTRKILIAHVPLTHREDISIPSGCLSHLGMGGLFFLCTPMTRFK